MANAGSGLKCKHYRGVGWYFILIFLASCSNRPPKEPTLPLSPTLVVVDRSSIALLDYTENESGISYQFENKGNTAVRKVRFQTSLGKDESVFELGILPGTQGTLALGRPDFVRGNATIAEIAYHGCRLNEPGNPTEYITKHVETRNAVWRLDSRNAPLTGTVSFEARFSSNPGITAPELSPPQFWFVVGDKKWLITTDVKLTDNFAPFVQRNVPLNALASEPLIDEVLGCSVSENSAYVDQYRQYQKDQSVWQDYILSPSK